MRYLYKKTLEKGEVNRFENEFIRSCYVKILKPTPFHLTIKAEKVTLSLLMSRLYFWFISVGRYRIFYLLDGDNLVHSSYVVPKCYKFPFLERGDYEIGPCLTSENYRKRGVYSYMLQLITTNPEFDNPEFYMIVSGDNYPSIRGIEKAGFQRCGTVKKTKIFKKFRLER
jgi:hypothetical protein